jgi:Thioesterase-like superfamily
MSEAVFERTDRGFHATGLARGPWDPQAQHGGAPAALLARAFERCAPSPELVLARLTYEFLRPVPLGDLAVEAELVRPGRRVQLLEASLRTPDGTEVVRARALRIRRADVDAVPETSVLTPGPERGRRNDLRRAELPMFSPDAIEIRFVAGGFYERGPASAWFRMCHPLLDGEEPSPLQRLAAAGDFGNGISAVVSWDDYLFINPDLTLYIEREPIGEWIGLRSETRIASGGVGIAESVLYDQRGRVGRATQALFVATR